MQSQYTINMCYLLKIKKNNLVASFATCLPTESYNHILGLNYYLTERSLTFVFIFI